MRRHLTALGMMVTASSVLYGCDGGGVEGSRSDATAENPMGDGGSVEGSRCNATVDTQVCEGKQLLFCGCTKPLATGPRGGPMCDVDGFTWIKGYLCSLACDTEIAPSAACLASTQPVAECAERLLTCWNGDLHACEGGYALETPPCPTGTQCTLVAGCDAFCLPPSAATDPACPPAPGRHDLCVDNTAYFCACGYLFGPQECGTAACTIIGGVEPDGIVETIAQCEPAAGTPACVMDIISELQSADVASPPSSVTAYVYAKNVVYFVPAHCCDVGKVAIESILYDAQCNVICKPDGGFAGTGDGRCPDFFDTRSDGWEIWRDSRSPWLRRPLGPEHQRR